MQFSSQLHEELLTYWVLFFNVKFSIKCYFDGMYWFCVADRLLENLSLWQSKSCDHYHTQIRRKVRYISEWLSLCP